MQTNDFTTTINFDLGYELNLLFKSKQSFCVKSLNHHEDVYIQHKKDSRISSSFQSSGHMNELCISKYWSQLAL